MQALALLSDYVRKDDPSIRIGAIMGLGLSYAGARNEEVMFLFFFWVWLYRNKTFCPVVKFILSLQSFTFFLRHYKIGLDMYNVTLSACFFSDQ